MVNDKWESFTTYKSTPATKAGAVPVNPIHELDRTIFTGSYLA